VMFPVGELVLPHSYSTARPTVPPELLDDAALELLDDAALELLDDAALELLDDAALDVEPPVLPVLMLVEPPLPPEPLVVADDELLDVTLVPPPEPPDVTLIPPPEPPEPVLVLLMPGRACPGSRPINCSHPKKTTPIASASHRPLVISHLSKRKERTPTLRAKTLRNVVRRPGPGRQGVRVIVRSPPCDASRQCAAATTWC
jgi:hypothetical protein